MIPDNRFRVYDKTLKWIGSKASYNIHDVLCMPATFTFLSKMLGTFDALIEITNPRYLYSLVSFIVTLPIHSS